MSSSWEAVTVKKEKKKRKVFFCSSALVNSNLIVPEKKSSLESALLSVALGTAHVRLPYSRWP